jgi:ATP-dependent exoDNAse (exonuclease V) alpha subunit
VRVRELLYTAVTRARTSVLIVRWAIEHRAERASGLAGRLHSPS